MLAFYSFLYILFKLIHIPIKYFIMLFSNIYPSKLEIQTSKTPLIILHGFLGMSDNWKSLAVQYAENGYDVHVLDLRNHGRSLHSDAFNYEVMTQDLFDYCKEKNIQNCYLLGHSMGGKLAMFFAAIYPNMVEKLIVADIAPKYYPPHHDEILNGLKAVDFTKNPSRVEVDDVLSTHIPDVNTRQFLLKSLYWKTPGQLAFRFNLQAFLNNKTSVGEALPTNAVFDKPTFFIIGGASNYVLDTDFNSIQTHFPVAMLEKIPNVGHWLHAENPAAFLQLTLNFLKS